MRPRGTIVVGLLAVLVTACGGASSPSGPTPTPTIAAGGGGGTTGSTAPASGEPPASGPASAETEPTPLPSDGGAGVVFLQGHIVGRSEGPLSSADQTIDFDLTWNAGPDDIHDIAAFVFTGGTFQSSVSIDGVCGGQRSESGTLTPSVDTALVADLGPDDQVQVSLVDARLEDGTVQIGSFSGLYVQEPDPAGCNNLSTYGVSVCPMRFQWLAIGELAREASCEEASQGTTWTGTLTPVP